MNTKPVAASEKVSWRCVLRHPEEACVALQSVEIKDMYKQTALSASCMMEVVQISTDTLVPGDPALRTSDKRHAMHVERPERNITASSCDLVYWRIARIELTKATKKPRSRGDEMTERWKTWCVANDLGVSDE